MHMRDWFPFKHRSKSSSKIPHFQLPISEGTCRVVQACAMGCIIKHDGLAPMKGLGTLPAPQDFSALTPNQFLFMCYHRKQRATKGSCLTVSERRQFPQNCLFKYWQQRLFCFWVLTCKRVTRISWWHFYLCRLSKQEGHQSLCMWD